VDTINPIFANIFYFIFISSEYRASAMYAGDPGSIPGRAINFSGSGYWLTYHKYFHFIDFCTSKKLQEVSKDFKEIIASSEHVQSNMMEMKWTLGSMLGISKHNRKLMQKKQNMTKLGHEIWSEESLTYVKSSLPEEP
jgi:hypothetical protein